jgi:hypothetical protein
MMVPCLFRNAFLNAGFFFRIRTQAILYMAKKGLRNTFSRIHTYLHTYIRIYTCHFVMISCLFRNAFSRVAAGHGRDKALQQHCYYYVLLTCVVREHIL